MYCYVRDCRNSAKNLKGKKKDSDLTKYFPSPEDKTLLEKWRRVIPRNDAVFSHNDKLCDLHFLTSEVLWFTETKLPNGNVRRLLRDEPILKPGTIPSIFPPEKLDDAKISVKATSVSVKERQDTPRPSVKTLNLPANDKFLTPKSSVKNPRITVIPKKEKVGTPNSSIRIRLREPIVEKRHPQRVKRRSTILDDYVTDDELNQVHNPVGRSRFVPTSKKRRTESSGMQPVIRLVPLECLMDKNNPQNTLPGKPISGTRPSTEEIDHELKKVIEIPLLTSLKQKKTVIFKTKDTVLFKPAKKTVSKARVKMIAESDNHVRASCSQITASDSDEGAALEDLNEVKTEEPDIEDELARMEMDEDDEDVKSDIVINEETENSCAANEEAKDSVSSFNEEDESQNVTIKSEDEEDEAVVYRGSDIVEREQTHVESSVPEGTSTNKEVDGSLLDKENSVNVQTTNGVEEATKTTDVAAETEKGKGVVDHGNNELNVTEDCISYQPKVAEDHERDVLKVTTNQRAESLVMEEHIGSGIKVTEGDKVDKEKDTQDKGDEAKVTEDGGGEKPKSVEEAEDVGSTEYVAVEGRQSVEVLNKDQAQDKGSIIVSAELNEFVESDLEKEAVGEIENNVEPKLSDRSVQPDEISHLLLNESQQLADKADTEELTEKTKVHSETEPRSDSNEAASISEKSKKTIKVDEERVETEISDKFEEAPITDQSGNVDISDETLPAMDHSKEEGDKSSSVELSCVIDKSNNVQTVEEDDDDLHMETNAPQEESSTKGQHMDNEDDIDIEAEVARLVSEVGESSEEPTKETDKDASEDIINISEDEENEPPRGSTEKDSNQSKEIILQDASKIGEITASGMQNLFSPETIQEILKKIKLPLTAPVTLRIAPLLNTPGSSGSNKGREGPVRGTRSTRRRGGRGPNRQLSRASSSKNVVHDSIEQFRQLTKTRTVFDFPTFISDIDDDVQYWKLCQIIRESFHELIEARNTKTSIGRLTLSIAINRPKRKELDSEVKAT